MRTFFVANARTVSGGHDCIVSWLPEHGIKSCRSMPGHAAIPHIDSLCFKAHSLCFEGIRVGSEGDPSVGA
jgi:hypothetical protein